MKFHIFRLNLSDRYSNPERWVGKEDEGELQWIKKALDDQFSTGTKKMITSRDSNSNLLVSLLWGRLPLSYFLWMNTNQSRNHLYICYYCIIGTWSDLREVVLWCFHPFYLLSREEGYPSLDEKSLGNLLPCYSSLIKDLTSWVTARENPLINGTDTKRRRESPPNSSVENDRTEKERIMRMAPCRPVILMGGLRSATSECVALSSLIQFTVTGFLEREWLLS